MCASVKAILVPSVYQSDVDFDIVGLLKPVCPGYFTLYVFTA